MTRRMDRKVERRIARRGAWPLLAALASLAGVESVAAQVPDTVSRDTVSFRLRELRIEALRPVASVSGASAVRLSLQSPRVAAVPLLEEALREIPFLQVRENSRGEAQPTLRGTEARQLAVLVDGVPLTLGWDARTDLSLIPVDAAREIQLFRGISSVLHGPNVLGGVVSIEIGHGSVDPDRRLNGMQGGMDATGAAFGGVRLGRTWSSGEGGVSVQAGGAYRTRDGVPLPGGVVQPAATDPNRRLNSDLDHASAFFTGRAESEGGAWVSTSAFGYRAARGVPPELHTTNPRRWRMPETKRVVSTVSAGTGWGRTPFGTGDFEVSIGIDTGDAQIDEFETLAYEDIAGQEFADDRTLTFRGLSDHELGDGVLRTALTVAETRHVERIAPGGESTFRQRLFSLGGEVELPLASAGAGFWSGARVSLGASWDRGSTPETGGREARETIDDWGARVGGSAQIGRRVRFHMGASRRVRFPSLRELYSGALGRFEPNHELAPEVLRAAEGGVTGTVEAFGAEVEAQAVLFVQSFSNAIVRTGLGDGRFRRENRRRVDAAGIELLGDARWGGVSVGGDLTWQHVEVTDRRLEGRTLRAEYQPGIAVGAHMEGPLPAGLRARAAVEAIGRQYCVDPDLDADVALDPTARVDLVVSREFAVGGPFRTLQTSLSLDNLADATVFDQCGLPQPGRLLRLQFRLF
ncbi:TonB-dependent receptor [Candidatus Palauibacter polyketidifaciens]|uniref:TonB-dependent receptor plug domain-containing protein n=1 Tax=Candidatus Palauibacter polyketidifaciens TaxID=3056740 RepID=UPI00239B37B9|nr:TonB-dependent receptor [Candidatus Palauibacter polyketidifaciens]MDE2721021.1 TonB-dependent receptor plug domain-containing protein [Candidatus Palauibacter polyketidifaciens]